jgi:hypothetical protein
LSQQRVHGQKTRGARANFGGSANDQISGERKNGVPNSMSRISTEIWEMFRERRSQ